MKIHRFGRAEILTPDQINVLFTEGFVNPRDRALFGVCLYAACRINEACTLVVNDVFGSNGVSGVLVLRSVNTKGKRSERHFLVDTLGLVLMVLVTSAYESDQAGARKLFAQAQNRISDRLNRLVLSFVDV